jgi:hypothetical protein
MEIMGNETRKLADDHARMKTANGNERVVPFWQIKDWEDSGVLGIGPGKVGYAIASASGTQSYEAWKAAIEAKKNVGKARASTFVRDGGMADAIQKIGGEETLSGPEPIIPAAGTIPPDTRPPKPGEKIPASPESGDNVGAEDVEVRDSL